MNTLSAYKLHFSIKSEKSDTLVITCNIYKGAIFLQEPRLLKLFSSANLFCNEIFSIWKLMLLIKVTLRVGSEYDNDVDNYVNEDDGEDLK